MTMGSDDDSSRPEIEERQATVTAVIPATLRPEELVAFFDRSFGRIAEVLAGQQVDIVGPAFARYHGPPGEVFDLEVGFPVAGEVVTDGEVRAGTLPGGRIARMVHVGGFDGLGDSWGALGAWIGSQGLTPSPDLWEVYVTEPSPEMDPADLRTELFWRVEP